MITETIDLLDAPTLFTQVYCATRILNEWPNRASLDAASFAVRIYGDDPRITAQSLNNVLEDVINHYSTLNKDPR